MTTAETLQFLQACNAQVAVAWRRVLSRSENGPAAVRLVEDGPLFRTLAHTEAERRNSDARLLHEFQLQVAKAGHVVEVEPYEEPAEKRKRKGPGLSAEAYSVLEARLLGYEEYQILKESRDVKRDRGTESVEVNKYEACAFYGLKELSESFLLQKVVDYKTPFSEPLLFLLKVLLHGRFLDPEAVGRKGQEIVRVEIAQELIKDLGFKHAFDRSFTPSLLKGGLMKKLMESRLFKGRQVYSGGKASLAEQSPAQMFQIELPKPEPGCDHLLPGQIKKVVDAVLRQMGLRLDGTVEVSRGARRGKGKNYESSSGKNDYKYRLHEKSIQRMAKLVKLQFREVPRVWRCRMDLLPAVRDFLDEVDASEFDNLLRRPSGLPMLAHLGPPEVDGEIDFGSRCMIVPRPRNDRSA